MKQQDFEKNYSPQWQDIEHFLTQSKKHRLNNKLSTKIPALYKDICYQLSLAIERQYSYHLIENLSQLANKLHSQIYKGRNSFKLKFLDFIFKDFPNTVHENRWYMLAGFILFFLPLGLTALACYLNPDLVYSIYPAEQVRAFDSMYSPENRILGRERDSGTDIEMFGFYIYNNIGIAFRTFATGALAGLGSLFFLIYNGLAIGAVMGYMADIGYYSTFFPFVIGHGSFELTAIAISGAAGLRLGGSILIPGSYSRLLAIRLAASSCIKLMYGAFIMLLIAAFLEAFWSSSTTISNTIKYSVGIGLWIIVCVPLLILTFRKREH
jgi:uncharacterized membrane protein SpoIIM required for sporulation